jgi:hypothetical protein
MANQHQYQEWAAAQGQPPLPPQVSLTTELEAQEELRREKQYEQVLERLPSLVDPIERLLTIMTTVKSTGAEVARLHRRVETVDLRWESLVAGLDPGWADERGRISYDSSAICKWFVRRADAVGLESTTFNPVAEKKKLFGGWKNVGEGPLRAWVFEQAVEQYQRGEHASDSDFYVLADGRAMTTRPATAVLTPQQQQSTMEVRELPPMILKRMGQLLGL